MQIIEVKNNLVKVSYDTSLENLILSGFVVVKETIQSFIGQIIHLEANSKGNFAVVRLLFNFDENGVITNYNGSIPNVKSLVDTVNTLELLELLPVQNPIFMGELAQQKIVLKLDRSLLEEKLLVCSEKQEDNKILVENFSKQLAFAGKKLLIIDIEGDIEGDSREDSNFCANKITAGKDFKLPLNYETINFIYEKGLDDAKAETKALIQDVFLEVQNYVKTLSEKFIPFETFKNVVDSQYEEMGLVELVLLKNKLLKYYEDGVFAQEKNEFNALKISLMNKDATILDLSAVEPEVQREMISYAYSLINGLNKEVYVMLNINNSNSDKKLLKQIFTTAGAYSTIICSYAYKYLKELKQLSKDLILFAPIQQQNDFAFYNTFLSKLNPHEFIIYGQAAHHLPLIVKLEEISDDFFEYLPSEDQTQREASASAQPQVQAGDLLDEQIKKDVDEIYITPRNKELEQDLQINESPVDNGFGDEFISDEFIEDDLTEDDLDFIEDIVNDEIQIREPEQEPAQEESQSDFVDEANYGIVEEAAEETQPSQEAAAQNINPLEGGQSTNFHEMLKNTPQAPSVDILPIRAASTPIVPIYPADIEQKEDAQKFEQGDTVMHPKYGKGTVEKLITYGSKTLCSIHFDNIGRRLLDPALAEIKKV